jgi:hypothetical protein
LYCGRIQSSDTDPLNMDQLLELLILADRFEIDSLKELCQEKLKSW